MITVLDWLESTAAKFADNIMCADAKKQITYADFVKNAQAIGSFLCKYEKMRQPVAVFMDNSVEAWEAMLKQDIADDIAENGTYKAPTDSAE